MSLTQVTLLRMLCRRTFYGQYGHLVTDNHFEAPEYGVIRRAIERVFNESDKMLAKLSDITVALESFGVDLDDYEPLLRRMADVQVQPGDYKKAAVIEFVRRSRLRSILRGAIDEMENTPEGASVMALKKEVDALLTATTVVDDEVTDYSSSTPAFHIDDAVPLNISPELDEIASIGPGELGLVLAGSNCGKSTMLTNIAVLHARDGGSPAIVTVDERRARYSRRIDQCVMAMTRQEMREDPVAAEKARDLVKEWGARIEIIDATHERTTVAAIRARLEQMDARNRKPTLLVVDYADKVFDPRTVDRHAEIEGIYDDLGVLSSALDLPVWTASQIKTPDYAYGKLNVTSAAWSQAKYDKCTSCIGLQQNEVMQHNSELQVSVLKSRNGSNRPEVMLGVDWDRQVVWRK